MMQPDYREIQEGWAAAQYFAHEVGGQRVFAQSQPRTLLHPALRILIVDNHALVRDALSNLINAQPDMQVIGQAGTIHAAIELSEQLHPDLILLDFALPDGTGDIAARAVRSLLPGTTIVFLTANDDIDRLNAAIAAGAADFMLKNIRASELIARLRRLAAMR